MNAFYDGPKRLENFVASLTHYLAIFSEGQPPIVPLMGNPVNISATLEAPCFRDFPERDRWLRSEKEAVTRGD